MIKPHFNNLPLALYCASIIIGAGLLTLPASAAQIGFIPLLCMVIGVGWFMMVIYNRFTLSLFGYLRRYSGHIASVVRDGLKIARGDSAESHHGKLDDENEIIADEVGARGSRQLANLIQDSGLGRAGKTSLVLGMFFYVFFATIGYLLLGSRSLSAIGTLVLATSPNSGLFWLFGGLAVMTAGFSFEHLFTNPFLLRGTLKKILVMAGIWIAGIGCIVWLRIHAAPPISSSIWFGNLDKFLFTASVILSILTRERASSSRSELSDQQRVNVVIMVINIALFAATVTTVLFYAHKNKLFVDFYAISGTAFSPTLDNIVSWANMFGVVLFAYVGTGLFNLCRHPKIFERQGRNRIPRLVNIVFLGTGIPMLVYLVWIAVSASVLPTSVLADLASSGEYSTIGISRLFLASQDVSGAMVISLFGYSVALLAVTTACNGFTESLADQLSVSLDGVEQLRWITGTRENVGMRLVIILAALLAVMLVDNYSAVDITSILAVAGNAGGGLLMLILPFFLPPLGRRKTTWQSIVMAMATAVTLICLLLVAARIWDVNSIGSGIFAGITIAIAICIGVIFVWLLRSEPFDLMDKSSSDQSNTA